MLGATLCGTVSSISVRYVSTALHPFEIAFFGSLFGSLVMGPLLLRRRMRGMKSRRPGLLALRGALNVIDILLLFSAYSLAPLAKVIALNFSAPLLATVLAVVVLGETIRLRRILALVTGFLGALLILRPGFGGLELGAVLALLAAATAGLAAIVVKVLARTESSATIALYTFVFTLPFTLVAALPVWTTPSLEQLALLVVVGVFSILIHFCLAQAYKEAELTAVLPLGFMRLIWVALFAYLLFGEVPDVWTWAGGTIIFLSTTYTALRESRLRGGDADRPDFVR